MTTINAADKRRLKSRGQKLESLLTVGKAGLTDGVLKEMNTALERSDLVKVRVNIEDRVEREVLFANLASASGAVCVSTVGRTGLIYRMPEGAANEGDATKEEL